MGPAPACPSRLRRQLRRTLAVSVALAAACAGVLSPTAAAAASGLVTVEYSGSWEFTFVYDESDPSSWQENGSYKWDEAETVRPCSSAQHGCPSAGYEVVGAPSLSISGSITSAYAPPNQGKDCTGSFSPAAGWQKGFTPSAISNSFSAYGTAQASDYVAAMIPEQLTQSSGAGDCSMAAGGPLPADFQVAPGADGPLAPYEDAKLDHLPWSRAFNLNYQVPGENITEDGTAELTISGGAAAHKPPAKTPARTRAKLNALRALRDTWERALYPCVAAGASTPLLGLGVPGVMTAAVLLPFAGTLCAAYEKTIAVEINTYSDPPLDSYHTLARARDPRPAPTSAPPCTKWTGKVRLLCEREEADLRTLAGKVADVEALAASVETTISRETAALNAGDSDATRRQDRRLAQLTRQLDRAESAATDAGKRFARLMHKADIPLGLTAAQAGAAIATLTTAVEADGVPQASLAPALGDRSIASASDWLKALGT